MSRKELKHSELLSIQSNAEENQNRENLNSELIERTEIAGTPFYLVGNEEHGYIITMGKFKLTQNKPTKEEAMNLLTTDYWNIILRMVTSLHESIMIEIGKQLMEEQGNKN